MKIRMMNRGIPDDTTKPTDARQAGGDGIPAWFYRQDLHPEYVDSACDDLDLVLEWKCTYIDLIKKMVATQSAELAELRGKYRHVSKLYDDLERDYVLTLFTEAEKRGFDLRKLVWDNAGKNCLQLFFEIVAPATQPPTPEAER